VELAKLHSKAVDYVKTGVPAEMEKKLKPRSFPHFMEKKNSYHSKKILGQMYDRVSRVHFTPNYEMPFDSRVLGRYKLDNEILKKARHIKSQYDTALKRIMGQMEIRTEFEVLSTFVMSKPRVGTAYKMHETIRRETDGLRKQFKDACIEAAGSRDFKELAPFVAAMYQVTNEEVRIALHESRTPHIRKDGTQGYRPIKPESMPLISFPWLFDGILGRIAKGSVEQGQQRKADTTGDAKEASSSKPKRSPGLDQKTLQEMECTYVDGRVVHRGQILRLFHHDDEDDEVAEEELESDQSLGGTDDTRALMAEMARLETGNQDESGPLVLPPMTAMMGSGETLIDGAMGQLDLLDNNDQNSSLVDEEEDLINFDSPARGTQRALMTSQWSENIQNLTLVDLDEEEVEVEEVVIETKAASSALEGLARFA
jgi:RNA-dependent RNA polymerase